MNDGGTLVAIGNSATNIAKHLQLPIQDHLVENGSTLPRTKFYVPGSVLSIKVDNTQPIGYGISEHVDAFFDASPVFKLAPAAAAWDLPNVSVNRNT